jgi:hypothetical protein
VDEEIGRWYRQQYEKNWAVYLRALIDMEAQYTKWFGGANPSGIRAKLKQWKVCFYCGWCDVYVGVGGVMCVRWRLIAACVLTPFQTNQPSNKSTGGLRLKHVQDSR